MIVCSQPVVFSKREYFLLVTVFFGIVFCLDLFQVGLLGSCEVLKTLYFALKRIDRICWVSGCRFGCGLRWQQRFTFILCCIDKHCLQLRAVHQSRVRGERGRSVMGDRNHSGVQYA